MNDKLRILIFFLIGLFVALIAEFWRFVIVLKQGTEWIPLIGGYVVFLIIAYFAIKLIKNNLFYYLFFALFGVIVYEILFLGTLPEIIASGIIGWITWLSFWGSVAFIPALWYKKELKLFTILFFFASLVFFLIIQFTTNFVGSMGLFYASLNIPYFFQLRKK